MKKIKIAILSIYIIFFIFVTGVSVYIVANAVKKITNIYFTEISRSEVKTISQSELENALDILKKFKIIK